LKSVVGKGRSTIRGRFSDRGGALGRADA
jgi:hypothetical protein